MIVPALWVEVLGGKNKEGRGEPWLSGSQEATGSLWVSPRIYMGYPVNGHQVEIRPIRCDNHLTVLSPTPGTCDYITLHDRRSFALRMMEKVLKVDMTLEWHGGTNPFIRNFLIWGRSWQGITGRQDVITKARGWMNVH